MLPPLLSPPRPVYKRPRLCILPDRLGTWLVGCINQQANLGKVEPMTTPLGAWRLTTSPPTARQQFTTVDTSPPLTPEQIKRLEQVTGKFLYIAQALDVTMMHALNDLATTKSNSSQETTKAVIYFLNYCASNPNPTKMYTVSDMFFVFTATLPTL